MSNILIPTKIKVNQVLTLEIVQEIRSIFFDHRIIVIKNPREKGPLYSITSAAKMTFLVVYTSSEGLHIRPFFQTNNPTIHINLTTKSDAVIMFEEYYSTKYDEEFISSPDDEIRVLHLSLIVEKYKHIYDKIIVEYE